LKDQDIHNFVDEMTEYVEMFKPAFRRPEQLEWSQRYLQGLLGNETRKNVERMALELGENVRSMQRFVGQSPWETERVVAIHQRLVGESLGDADGVALIDESSVVKRGENSVGVGAPYCGWVGKTAKGQVGVHLGYASRKGYSLIDEQLFVLEEWFACASTAGTGEEAHAEKRKECGAGRLGVPDQARNRFEIAASRGKTRRFALFLGGSG
jgi:SRSO17 transposase